MSTTIKMRPRITVYALSDTTYSTQLYSYNSFTDSGSTAKPLALQFDSDTNTAGTFSLTIEDSDRTLDQEVFIRGNRVVIELSNDGGTWQTAFKGVVRSCESLIDSPTAREFTISGYSYLVRFNERIINAVRESAIVNGVYDRTDSTMFTNNLINTLLTDDTNYIYSLDDTQIYSLFKTTNLTSSPINTWVPRVDAELATITDALNQVLSYSGALITMDPSNDQLVLYDPLQVTAGTGVFLITDQPNLKADNAAYTMYPIQPYKYNIAYDLPDSANRLISSIGNIGACVDQGTITPPTDITTFTKTAGQTISWWSRTNGVLRIEINLEIATPPITAISIGVRHSC